MSKPEALRLADAIRTHEQHPQFNLMKKASAELRRLHHNNEVLLNALWKACGDDGNVVADTIESQGELK